MDYGTVETGAGSSHDARAMGPPGAGGPPDARAQAPLFSARVDDAAGVIRVRGHLDREGVEQLAPSLDWLRRAGHRRITVEVSPLGTAEAGARELLDDLARRLATGQVRLVVR